mgnify:CR=1 FL=1
MVLRKRKVEVEAKDKDNDKFLVELWRYENEVRKMEGLPPIPWEVWLSWYKWHRRQAQQDNIGW